MYARSVRLDNGAQSSAGVQMHFCRLVLLVVSCALLCSWLRLAFVVPTSCVLSPRLFAVLLEVALLDWEKLSVRALALAEFAGSNSLCVMCLHT